MYSQMFLLCHICLHVLISAKFWCFLQTGDAVIEGACMLIFFFIIIIFPAACLHSTALTTAGGVCVCVCVLL